MAQFISRNNSLSDRNNDVYEVVLDGGFLVPPHDFINNTYDANSNLTLVEYYIGGVGGDKVAEIVLTYDASDNLLTVTRSL